MLIGTFTHGKGFAYFSFSIGHKNQIDSHAITWNCLKLTAIQSRYNLCQFWMTVKMHYKSYIYSVNYNSEFHIITKIQIFNCFFFCQKYNAFSGILMEEERNRPHCASPRKIRRLLHIGLDCAYAEQC